MSAGLDKNNLNNTLDIYALTPLQEGILFHYLQKPGNEAYCEQLVLELNGELSTEHLHEAWDRVVAENHVLRTVFRWERVKQPLQLVLKEKKIGWRFYDIPETVQGREDILRKELGEGFDLREEVIRVALVKLGTGKHEFILTFHHILLDGWSTGIVLNRLMELYDSISRGLPVDDPQTKPFKDFVKYCGDFDAEAEGAFWTEYLMDFEIPGPLPGKQRAPGGKKAGDRYRLNMDEALWRQMLEAIKARKTTLAAMLYCGWGLLSHYYTGEDDVVFGTTVSGRNARVNGIEQIVGLCINTIPCRIKSNRDFSLDDVLGMATILLRDREQFENTPLVRIAEYMSLGQATQLFDNLLVLENYPLDRRLLEGDHILCPGTYEMREVTHYDLTVGIETRDTLELEFEYNPDAFHPAVIRRMAGHFVNVLTQIVWEPGKRASAIDVLTGEEMMRIADEFNKPSQVESTEETIVNIVANQVQKNPDAAALIFEDRMLTYSVLDAAAHAESASLRELGLREGDIAAGLMERSDTMVIGVLAVLKLGAALMPMAPKAPTQRLLFMLGDADCKLVVTDRQTGLKTDLTGFSGSIVPISGRPKEVAEAVGSSDSGPYPSAQSPAFVFYTSGTTGVPKGILVEHRNVVNVLRWFGRTFDLSPGRKVFCLSDYTFDPSVEDIFGSLSSGAALVQADKSLLFDPPEFCRFMEKHDIFLINGVPSLLRELLPQDRRVQGLKVVISGGEPIDDGLKERLLAQEYSLFNNYGPTEITVDACSARLTEEPVTLGFPIDNVRCYVMNRWMRPLPPGVAGELCVGGAGVGRGYLNDPEATNRVFVKSPLNQEEVLYRTGDRAEWLEDGRFRFMGRLDRQFKIRGFRVDPGEIEHVLVGHPGVQDGVVVYRNELDKPPGLYAYLVSGDSVSLDEINAFLKEALPDYMIPDALIPVEKIPVTATGKVDMKALPSFEPPNRGEEVELSPQTSVQKRVAGVWKEVLQRESIGGHENFFDAGGNSLLVIRLSSRLKKEFNVDVPVTSIFQHPSISALSGYIEGCMSGGDPEETGYDLPRVETAKSRPRETSPPVAIVGMAGRFPGASNVREFWRNLVEGVESISHFSYQELAGMGIDESLYRSDNYVAAKGVLQGYEYFDEDFFGFSSREAEMMDPQLRVLCEVTWEVLEDAACDPSSFDGAIGLYAGTLSNFQWMRQMFRSVSDHADFMALESLNDRDFVCSRISYALDLKGPAVTVQTACSTSLVAVGAACNALAANQCQMAIAGGVSITLEDEGGYLFQEGMVRSPDGRCRAFDAAAAGTVGGNGAGLVALKCLERAQGDGDHIYAIIKGWAVNNDGARKVGYAAPSISGQMEVIRLAQERAGVSPGSIGFVEAHGTGTPLGDPVEFEALRQVFGEAGDSECAIGAVKTNIGHLDAAAGIAGLLKATLALYHRMIPPTLHFEAPNPKIDLEHSPFYIGSRLIEWQRGESPLRVGVSSFGIGGTNAHMVVEEWLSPEREAVDSEVVIEPDSKPYHIFLLSAGTKDALTLRRDRLKEYLSENPDLELGDVAYTLQVGRKGLRRRMWCPAQSKDQLMEALTQPDGGKVRSAISPEERPRVFFMFPGQGAQYIDMGRELYQIEPLFRTELDKCFELLNPLMGFDVRQALYPAGKDSSIEDYDLQSTDMAQPLMVAFEYALARCLIHWGIRPDGMIGHSIGEYSAALLAGVFSLKDALEVAVERGRIVRALPEGAMLSVPLREDEVDPLIDEEKGLALAAVNSDSSVVISGPVSTIDELAGQLLKKGISSSKLHTSHAFHSPMMEPGMKSFERAIGEVQLNDPQIPFVLNINGKWTSDHEVTDPGYWVEHLRKTVRFADGIGQMMNMGDAVFIEVGPGNTLCTLARKHHHRKDGHTFVNLFRHPKEYYSDHRLLLEKLGEVWSAGVTVDWEAFNHGKGYRRIPLPTYPFGRRYFWKYGAGIPRLIGSGRKPEAQNMFYVPVWESLECSWKSELPVKEGEPWLIFVDDSGLGQNLGEWLRGLGVRPILVVAGTDYMQCSPHRYYVNPRYSENYRNLVFQLKTDGNLPVRLVFLWDLFPKERLVSEAPDNELIHSSGFSGLLALAQAFGEVGSNDLVHISLITNRLHRISREESFRPDRSMTVGLCRVIQQEYQEIFCRHIDIDEDVNSIGPQELAHAITVDFEKEEPGREMIELAIRGGQMFTRIYQPLRFPLAKDKGGRSVAGLKKGMVVVISGGLGGIGLEIAAYLGKNFRARLVLADCSPFPPPGEWNEWLVKHEPEDEVSAKIIRLKAILDYGAGIEVSRADVSDAKQVEALVDDVCRRYGSVDGVVHAAGIPDAGIIQQKTAGAAMETMKAKVLGTKHLARTLRRLPCEAQPRFLYLFSTFSTVVGAYGQAAYVAANTYQDVFASYDFHDDGMIVLTINWDRWADVGMAVQGLKNLSRGLHVNRLDNSGISSTQGVEAFDKILNHLPFLRKQGVSRVIVTPHSLDEWREQVRSSGVDHILDHVKLVQDEEKSSKKKRPRLSVDYTPPSTSLEEQLADLWKDFLGLQQVGIHDNFFELGASSLDLVQFNARLNRAIQRDVSLVHLYAHPTVASLAFFLTGDDGAIDSTGKDSHGGLGADARAMLAVAARKLRKD